MSHSTLTETGLCCPFCGHARTEAVGPCPRCTMEDTPTTRASTAARVGPWFVLQRKNPTAPGLRYSVLLSLVKRGLVTTDSILRGPTTQQLWRRATQVRGVARSFGICWNCTSSVSAEAKTCARCGESQEPPADPDLFLDAPKVTVQTESTDPAGIKPIDDGFDSQPADASPREFIARDQPHRIAAQAIMSAKELATVFQLNPSAVRQPSHARRSLETAFKFALATLLIATTGIAALLYVKPELREPIKQRFPSLFGEPSTVVTDDYQLPSLAIEKPLVADVESEPIVPPAIQADPSPIQPDIEPSQTDPGEKKSSEEIQPISNQPPPKEPVPSWLELFEQGKLNQPIDETDPPADDAIQAEPDIQSSTTQPTSEPIVPMEQENPIVADLPPTDVPPTETTIAPTETTEVAVDERAPIGLPTMPQLADPHEQLRALRAMAADFERKENYPFAIHCYQLMYELPEEFRPTNIATQIDRLKRRAEIDE